MSGAGNANNRLAASRSPYLLLHRHNPVDWYEWGDEALDAYVSEVVPKVRAATA